MLLWHGTSCEFDDPRPLTHFGSRKAARSAPNYRGVLLRFDVQIRRPLPVQDTPGGGDIWYWMQQATALGVISVKEFSVWERCPTDAATIDLLSSKGFDGLVYTNRYEDPGSRSWVIFYPEQAKRVA